MENSNRSILQKALINLSTGQLDRFFEYVDPQVVWIVEGTHPLAGNYHSLEEFKNATFDRLDLVLKHPEKFHIEEMIVEGDKAAIILESNSVTNLGNPYHNRSCWIVEMKNNLIVKARSFSDSQLITKVFKNVRPDICEACE